MKPPCPAPKGSSPGWVEFSLSGLLRQRIAKERIKKLIGD